MDTKWKSLNSDEYKNYGISQADMYQMYAYSKKYGTPEIWLLYPINREMRAYKDICFDSGDGTQVNVFFVDIENISDSIEHLRILIDV
jgi:5-methylcytosine-specific restriction enzyme subunit McrC